MRSRTLFCLVGVLALQGLALAQAYPLKKSANGRYLVDQNNAPFLVAGDAPQSLMVNISEADAETFFANRQSHGFNAVWINLLCNTYTAGRSDSSTYDGILPFTTPNDFSTPNSAYFTRCDHMITMAANHGLVVFLDPAETGSFLSVMHSNGATKCRAFGQYLGNRYKNFDNIIWMSGNDYQSWSNASDDSVVTAVALGIKDTDTRHLHTIELDYLVSGSLDDPNWAPIISLNASYTYYPTYAQVLTDYNRPNFLPVFMVEANYEFESLRGYLTTAYICRKQEYWTNLSGATGQLYGSGYTWTFKSGWKTTLDSPGAVQMAYVKALFEPRAWHALVPDQSHSVLTAGYGTFSSSGGDDTNDYVTAARVPDGSLVMAYTPIVRQLTIDMTKLGGPVTARWYDPSKGTFVAISGSPFANTGSRNFTPAGNNSAGDGDWVLVLESTPASGTPPTITKQPANQTVTAGQTATFSVTATGSATLGYQWQKNGVPIPGATGSSYTTPPTTLADSGSMVRCIVSNGAGSATSNSATLTVNPPAGGSLPSPWIDQDVGTTGAAGNASYATGTFNVSGAGADIWGTADGFNFVYQTLTGDGSIVAEVTGLGNTDPWAKAGVMIRETLNANSAYADTLVTAGNGTTVQWRPSTGASAQESPAGPNVTAPYWVKLERVGNDFTGSVSSNGSSWTMVGTATIPMSATVYIGLAVTSHQSGTTTPATLGSVSGTGGWAVGGGSGGGGSGGGAGGGGGGGGGGCGLTGVELPCLIGLLGLIRRAGGRKAFGLLAVVASATGVFAESPASSPITAPLAVSTSNPNYFQDASGTPIALCGSHSWNTLQDWGTNGTPQTLDFNAFVGFLTAHGHNFTLLWTTELPKFSNLPVTAASPPEFTVSLFPWQRTGPGSASDGKQKFDLTKFNQAYFDQLRARVQALNGAGIYAGVYFFTGEWLKAFRSSTDGYPFSGPNNVNGIADDGALSSITMSAANAITGTQDAFIKKTIDTLNDLPNVLWIVSEEAPSGSAWWNGHVISTARAYEATKPFVHPIGFASPDNGDAALYNSNADWVAPIARISPTQTSGTGAPAHKVNINDSDHSYFGMWNDSAQTNRNYAWENFVNGNQVVFMDPYLVYYPRENRNLSPTPVDGISAAPDPRWNNFRDNLGYILNYSRKLNLAKVSAHGSLSSTGWCLAQVPATGAEYLVYAPGGGAFTVDLSAMAATRSLNVEWFNPATGAATAAGPVSAGAGRSFTPPFGGDAVLYLVDTAGHAGGSPPTAPAITTQPANQTVTAGQTATFSVAASRSAPLSYQWQKNGTTITGATGSTYTTPATAPGDSGATFRCVVSNAAGTATSTAALLTVNSPSGGSLPSPWADLDIGAVGATGSATYSTGTFNVLGAGADIWGTADGFNFVYETLTGDGSIVAEVTGLGNTDPWAKAGVMMRETLNANSAFADTLVTAANGTSVQWRASTGAGAQSSAAGPSVTAPYWVKLERVGDDFTGSVSSNGSSWTLVGSATISMAATIYIGLAVTSHKAGTTTAATIGSVSGTGGWPVGGGIGAGGSGGVVPSGSSHHGGCGATGLEILIIAALLAPLRGRRA